MPSEGLGKIYHDGQVLFRQGEIGECMYVIQSGQVQIVREQDGKQVVLATRGEGEIIGEMAIIERQPRVATVRVVGEARILTIDKKNFLRRVHQDPSLAYRILQKTSRRVRELSDKLARLEAKQ